LPYIPVHELQAVMMRKYKDNTLLAVPTSCIPGTSRRSLRVSPSCRRKSSDSTFFHKLPLSTMALQITPPMDMGKKYL
jgi:hypothetical protein